MNQNITIYGSGRLGQAIAKYFPGAVMIDKETKDKKVLLLNSDNIIVTCRGKSKLKIGSTALETRMNELLDNILGIDELRTTMGDSKKDLTVVTNSVDLVARYLQESLPLARVRAFGLAVDKYRFSEYLGVDVDVVGFHGEAIPVLDLKDEQEYIRIMERVNEISLHNFVNNGINYDLCSKIFFEDFNEPYRPTQKVRLNDVEQRILERTKAKFELSYQTFIKERAETF